MPEVINRGEVKRAAAAALRGAQVPAIPFYALFFALKLVLDTAMTLAVGDATLETLLSRPVGLFAMILTYMLSPVLTTGCLLYCMAVRQGQRAEYLSLFDGFSFVVKIIAVSAMQYLVALVWSTPLGFVLVGGTQGQLSLPLLVIAAAMPVAALYRYRFALLGLCADPGLGPVGAMGLSLRRTMGYKRQLFLLDANFFVWMLAAHLPSLYLYAAYYAPMLGFSLPAPSISPLVQVLVQDAVVGLVGFFYLPRYHCCQVAYFETACRTSGTEQLPPRPDDRDEN